MHKPTTPGQGKNRKTAPGQGKKKTGPARRTLSNPEKLTGSPLHSEPVEVHDEDVDFSTVDLTTVIPHDPKNVITECSNFFVFTMFCLSVTPSCIYIYATMKAEDKEGTRSKRLRNAGTIF